MNTRENRHSAETTYRNKRAYMARLSKDVRSLLLHRLSRETAAAVVTFIKPTTTVGQSISKVLRLISAWAVILTSSSPTSEPLILTPI